MQLRCRDSRCWDLKNSHVAPIHNLVGLEWAPSQSCPREESFEAQTCARCGRGRGTRWRQEGTRRVAPTSRTDVGALRRSLCSKHRCNWTWVPWMWTQGRVFWTKWLWEWWTGQGQARINRSEIAWARPSDSTSSSCTWSWLWPFCHPASQDPPHPPLPPLGSLQTALSSPFESEALPRLVLAYRHSWRSTFNLDGDVPEIKNCIANIE